MKLPSTSSVVLVGGGLVAAIAGLWELWTIVNKISGDTFSAVISKMGEGQTFIPFMDGMLAGHLWRDNKSFAAHIIGQICGRYFWPLLDKEDQTQLAREATQPS